MNRFVGAPHLLQVRSTHMIFIFIFILGILCVFRFVFILASVIVFHLISCVSKEEEEKNKLKLFQRIPFRRWYLIIWWCFPSIAHTYFSNYFNIFFVFYFFSVLQEFLWCERNTNCFWLICVCRTKMFRRLTTTPCIQICML